MTGRTIIRAGRLLAWAEGHIESDRAIVIADGRVEAIEPWSSALVLTNDRLIDATDRLVMPGLINAHHHVGLTPTQLGIADAPLEIWIARRYGAPAVDPYLDTLCAAAEMLSHGITTVQHLQGRLFGDPAMFASEDDAILRAYADIGMRVSYSRGLTDQCRIVCASDDEFLAGLDSTERSAIEPLLAHPAQPPDQQVGQSYAELRSRWHGREDGRIAIQLAPVNLHWCSDELLLLAEQSSAADGTPMHMHLGETPYQAVYARMRSGGRSAVAHLRDLGLLSSRLTLGHAVWVNGDDIADIARTGTCICHNASSNLRLQSGVAPIRRFLAEGVTVALGIDEAGLSDRRAMMDEIRLAWALTCAPGHESAMLDGSRFLRLALDGAAATTPFGETIGRLAPQSAADLLILDWNEVAGIYLEKERDVSTLVRRMVTSAIRSVMVAGRIVHEDGSHCAVDIPAAAAELRARTQRAAAQDLERRQRTASILERAVRRFYATPPWTEWRALTDGSHQ